MKYINSSFEEINIDEKLCLTIGNFDGIHKGHREIIKNLIQKTNISNATFQSSTYTSPGKRRRSDVSMVENTNTEFYDINDEEDDETKKIYPSPPVNFL